MVCDRFGDALYFSRRPLPWAEADGAAESAGLRHIGLYAYRKAFLLELARMEPTPLERLERLEQLRVLENGHRIRVAVVAARDSMIEIDTPEDLERMRALLAVRSSRDGGMEAMRERHG